VDTDDLSSLPKECDVYALTVQKLHYCLLVLTTHSNISINAEHNVHVLYASW